MNYSQNKADVRVHCIYVVTVDTDGYLMHYAAAAADSTCFASSDIIPSPSIIVTTPSALISMTTIS
jgi:hypothetical protein